MKPPAPQIAPARTGAIHGRRRGQAFNKRVGEQQRQDRHGEPARQDRPSGDIENAVRARPEHPSHQTGDGPAKPQQLLHNDKEADDANDVDEHGAGVETVIAEIYDVGDEVQEKQVAQSVLRLGFEVGHGPETDLFQDAQVNMRVIVVEPCQGARVTGDYITQGDNADPAIGKDGDEHGAEQAVGQPAMGNFSDRPSPGIPAIEDEARHGVVKDHEGHDDEVGEGQLTLVQQPPLDDHVLPRHAGVRQRKPGISGDAADETGAVENDGKNVGGEGPVLANGQAHAPGDAGNDAVETATSACRCGMDKRQRGRRRRQRREDERTLGRKEGDLDEKKQRCGEGDEATQVEIGRRLEQRAPDAPDRRRFRHYLALLRIDDRPQINRFDTTNLHMMSMTRPIEAAMKVCPSKRW